MRGDDQQQDGMFSYISPDKRVPQDHPLRRIRVIVDRVLEQLSPRFNKLYARAGRPSIAPEKLLRALLLQLLYSVRSERLLMEQLNYNLLFRWFVGVGGAGSPSDAQTPGNDDCHSQPQFRLSIRPCNGIMTDCVSRVKSGLAPKTNQFLKLDDSCVPSRSTHGLGSELMSSRKTPFVQPNPMMLLR